MLGLGALEITVIMLGILVLFGAKKIPELARGLGKGIKDFKKEINPIETEIKSVTKEISH